MADNKDNLQKKIDALEKENSLLKKETHALKFKLSQYRSKDLLYLQNIIESLPEYIFWKDISLNYQGCNKKVSDYLGLSSPTDILGKSDHDFNWSSERIRALHEIDKEVINNAVNSVVEDIIPDDKGNERIMLTSKSPMRDNQGRIIGIIGVSTDITEIKNYEKELIVVKDKALVANKAKSAFIANMSHDIRTPITGMLGLIQHISSTVEKSKAFLAERNTQQGCNKLNDSLNVIKDDSHYLMGATDQLLQLCNEILEVVRLESGESTHQSESFSLHDIIEHNIELFQPTAHHKNLQLSYSIDPNVPHYLNGSRLYLTRVLLNLMSNALKFTQAGTVKVSAQALGSGGDVKVGETITIRILVEDTGIGIPKDKFDTIFEHFSRLTPSYEGSYPGAGLGLYTVKRYIEAMQGNIDVSSELNQGTCFTVTVPLTVSDHADRVKQSVRFPKLTQPVNAQKMVDTQQSLAAKDAAASILVVEDNHLAAIAIKLALKPFHCHVETAETGSQAVKMAQSGSYDLILMDIGLPDFSGIEATKKIRALSDPKKSQVPIIALTGHANSPNMRQEALDSGMQDVMSKPAQSPALESMFKKYIFNAPTKAE